MFFLEHHEVWKNGTMAPSGRAIMSFSPPSALYQPIQRQNSLDRVLRFSAGGPAISSRSSAISAGREVATVVAALDRAGHRGAVGSRRRVSSIDHGSQGAVSSGGRPPLRARPQPGPEPVQAIDAVQRQDADHGVHHRGEPGAGLGVGAERQSPSDRRPAQHQYRHPKIPRISPMLGTRATARFAYLSSPCSRVAESGLGDCRPGVERRLLMWAPFER